MVEGPAGATVLSAKAMGWKWPAWHTFYSRQGLKIDIRETCPKDVEAMARTDATDCAWERWVEADEKRSCLGPKPLIEPAKRWLKKRGNGPGGKAARQAVTGGQWTQARYHARGKAEHPYYLACLAKWGSSARRRTAPRSSLP